MWICSFATLYSTVNVKCLAPEELFAGKMHALLFRKWKTNVKGRDWYDLEWYIQKGVALNLDHFLLGAKNRGDWLQERITAVEFLQLLNKRKAEVNIERAKKDVSRFIHNPDVLYIWSQKYFMDLIKQLKVK